MPSTLSNLLGLSVLSSLALAGTSYLPAELRLPHVLSSGMVLQRDKPIHLWGWATPGASVTVTLGSDHGIATTDELGHWSVYLPPLPASSKPATLLVDGDGGHLALDNILLGDLWIASGQSNMEMPLKGFGPDTPVAGSEQAIAGATDSQIRLLLTPRVSSPFPLDDAAATWQVCSPATARDFSAAGYFFARQLRSDEKVPIGIVDTSWGGTPAESWVSLNALSHDANLLPVFQTHDRFLLHQTELGATVAREKREDQAAAAAGQPKPVHPWHPDPPSYDLAGLFNGMIAPYTPLSIRGVIWYQGETNSGLDRAPVYARLFRAHVMDWRAQWAQGDFPFLYAQISSFRSSPQEAWGVARDAERRALALRNTGMAVTLDVGNPTNVHPADKQTVGHRLALLAEQISYGRQVDATGPLFERADLEGASLRVGFSTPDLVCRGDCAGFEIAGSDHHFVPATARLDRGTVVVSATDVKAPAYVRYAWPNAPAFSLFDKAGLPASTFTSESEDELSGDRLIPTSYGQTQP